jgi:hypothetical protein
MAVALPSLAGDAKATPRLFSRPDPPPQYEVPLGLGGFPALQVRSLRRRRRQHPGASRGSSLSPGARVALLIADGHHLH